MNAVTSSLATETISIEDIYFYPHQGKYFRKTESNKWIGFTKDDTRAYLTMTYGITSKRDKNSGISEADKALLQIQSKNCIEDHIALCGYCEGVHTIFGRKTLVTASPTFIVPQAGDWTPIDTLLTQMLGETQKEIFLGWSKYGLSNLMIPDFSALGQAMFLVGKRGTCKSLLADLIIALLGGRFADPHQYLMGETSFNSQFFESEVLFIDDKPGKNWGENQDFSMLVKNITASDQQYYHPKGKPALQYPVKWRLVVALNKEADAIKSIPTLIDSMQDKITIFEVQKPNMDIPHEIMSNKKALRAYFHQYLPAFAHYLLNEHVVRPELLDPTYRFGVISYHNSQIVSEMKSPIHANIVELFEQRTLLYPNKRISVTPTSIIQLWKLLGLALDRSYSNPVALGRRMTEMYESKCYPSLTKLENGRGYILGTEVTNSGRPIRSLDSIIEELQKQYHAHDRAKGSSTYSIIYDEIMKAL